MAIAVGSAVVNQGALLGAMPAVLGQVIAAGTPPNSWNVLWQNGSIALDVVELNNLVEVEASTLRPAVREASTAGGVAPAPDAVGMVISQTVGGFNLIIRTPAGLQYVTSVGTIKYLDE